MPRKNFRATGGIDIDSSAIPILVIQETITSNLATTVDTISLDSFTASEYTVTLKQGSKIRTSKVIMQTDGTSVDMTEFAITETGGTISGVVVSATTASTNAVLQITVTDAATTLVRYKLIRNISTTIQYAPDAPTIGTATAGAALAIVTFTAPVDNGGSEITSYTATSNPGNITASSSTSPITVTSLTPGTAYTFIVTATNANGTSAASSATNSVTPTEPPVQAAYWGGNTSGVNTTTVDKMAFSTETSSTVSSQTADGIAIGFSNSGTAGYVTSSSGGGSTGSNRNLDKYNYTGDVKSVLSNALDSAKTGGAPLSNSGVAGYRIGNHLGVYSANSSKFNYSNETGSAISNLISSTVWYGGRNGASNSGVAGYAAGGSNRYINSSLTSDIYKISFSTDTATKLTATLTSAGSETQTASSNSGTACYFAISAATNNFDKLQFSTDTKTIVSNSNYVGNMTGNAKVGTAGYFAGSGSNEALGGRNAVKILFSNDTTSSLSNILSTATRWTPPSFSNSGTL